MELPLDLLSKLSNKYNSDKYSGHKYTPLYFEKFKDKIEDIKRVCEIGIATGASLKMWRDFFPNALIIGIDNREDCQLVGEERIISILADGTTIEDDRLFDFDLIVDDASHDPDQQIKSFELLFPKLINTGLYIIEDVDGNSCQKTLAYFKELKELNIEFDGQLIMITKEEAIKENGK